MVVGNSDGKVNKKEAEELFASSEYENEEPLSMDIDSVGALERNNVTVEDVTQKFNQAVQRLATQKLNPKQKIEIEELNNANTIDQANKNFLQTSNFGLDLSKIENLHDLFDFKMKTEGLSKEELEMRM